jgi:restriction system protein
MSTIASSFDRLVQQIAEEVAALERSGADALLVGSYHEAMDSINCAAAARTVLEKLKALRDEWAALPETIAADKAGVQLRRDDLPEQTTDQPRALAYQELYRPILATLSAMGGSARRKAVLDRIHPLLESRLTQHDLERYKSGGVRWRSKAETARGKLRNAGLLADDSPKGIWEITHKGRRWLQRQEQNLDTRGPQE